MKKITLLAIKFYKKFISIFSYGSCRFYPTCSEYAVWEFENNNFFKALYNTILRIFRCNQFFAGGIDYPKLSNNKLRKVSFGKRKIKYWLVPAGNKLKIIKNREWKKWINSTHKKEF